MIAFERRVLSNGLTVLVHQDTSTRMCAVNLIYKVGARNENPSHTGLAHLFEHLMFGGSKHAPNFDTPLQNACGENNAFTNNDYTDFYITLPSENIETAFWLESDRMNNLNLDENLLEQEKRIVVEEFNQRFLNQPYGDLWLILRPMVYKVHPYRWSAIGMTADHIKQMELSTVQEFYNRFYRPSNAILSVASDLDPQRVFELADKWFGGISHSPIEDNGLIPEEPVQTQLRHQVIHRNVPATVITHVFHMGGRTSREFNEGDVLSDLLAGGNSARLYRRLVHQKQLFSSVNSYVSGEFDPGMFVATGTVAQGVDYRRAEEALLEELRLMQSEQISDYELQKVRNRYEAGTLFGELNIMNKAMNMGFYDMLGDASVMNREIQIYNSISKSDIAACAERLFADSNRSTLIYASNEDK